MRIVAILAVLLFAFASVSVSTISAAWASGVAGPVAAPVVDTLVCQADLAAAKSPSFKPCEKRINGQAVTCHFDTGLLLDCLAGTFERAAAEPVIFRAAVPELSLIRAPFRPPQLA